MRGADLLQSLSSSLPASNLLACECSC
jgi:hypothetical protein